MDRALGLLVFGILALFVSVIIAWYDQPSSLLSYSRPDYDLILGESISIFEVMIKIVIFLYSSIVLSAVMLRRVHGSGLRRMAWVVMVLLLILPYWIRQWEPDRFLDSHLLYHGMEQVIFEMEVAMPQQQRDWRDWQVLTMSAMENPLRTSGYEMDGRGTWVLSLIKGYLISQTWGLNNIFLAFVAKGWIAGLLGTWFVLLGCYLKIEKPILHFRRDIAFAAVLAMVLAAALLVPRFMNEYHLQAGDHAYYQGDFSNARYHWNMALKWQPSISHAFFHFYNRNGEMSRRLGCETCLESRLALAFKEVAHRHYEDALSLLYRVQQDYPDHAEIRYGLGTVHTILGNSLFNQGQYTAAKEHWEYAIRHLPIYPLPWYGLSLVYFRLKEFDKAEACAEQIVKLQHYFSFKKLTIRGQDYVAKSWAAYWKRDWKQAHDFYSRSLAPERWP